MNCEDCDFLHTFEAFYDEWKGMQYDSECTASFEDMPLKCAKELGYEDEWYDCHQNVARTREEIMESRREDEQWN